MSVEFIRVDAAIKKQGLLGIEGICQYLVCPTKEQVPIIQEIKVLEEIGENDKVVYCKVKIPLLSERFVCLRVTVTDQENGKFIVCQTVQREDAP